MPKRTKIEIYGGDYAVAALCAVHADGTRLDLTNPDVDVYVLQKGRPRKYPLTKGTWRFTFRLTNGTKGTIRIKQGRKKLYGKEHTGNQQQTIEFKVPK